MENPSEVGPVCPECGQAYGFKVREDIEYDPKTGKPTRKITTWKCGFGHTWTTSEELNADAPNTQT